MYIVCEICYYCYCAWFLCLLWSFPNLCMDSVIAPASAKASPTVPADTQFNCIFWLMSAYFLCMKLYRLFALLQVSFSGSDFWSFACRSFAVQGYAWDLDMIKPVMLRVFSNDFDISVLWTVFVIDVIYQQNIYLVLVGTVHELSFISGPADRRLQKPAEGFDGAEGGTWCLN